MSLSRKNKHSGFTLVELMVVMAIIAILATAGLSAYTNYIDKARITKVGEFARGVDTNLVDKLVLRLDFDNNFLDTSGYNNIVTGTGANQIYETGINGQSLHLSLSSNITVASNTILDSPIFTMAAWVRPSLLVGPAGNTYPYSILFMQGLVGPSGRRLGISPIGKVTFWTTENGGNIYITSASKARIGRWIHLAVVYDGGKAFLYIDGKKEAEQTGSYIPAVGYDLRINYTFYSPDISYDDVRIYSSSLLAGDIEKMYRESAFKYLAQR